MSTSPNDIYMEKIAFDSISQPPLTGMFVIQDKVVRSQSCPTSAFYLHSRWTSHFDQDVKMVRLTWGKTSTNTRHAGANSMDQRLQHTLNSVSDCCTELSKAKNVFWNFLVDEAIGTIVWAQLSNEWA